MKQKGRSPCLGCADRVPGCHGKCEKYQGWRAEVMKARVKYPEQGEAYKYMVDKVTKKMRRRKYNGQS